MAKKATPTELLKRKNKRLEKLLREVEYFFAHGGQCDGDQVDLWARISDELGDED